MDPSTDATSSPVNQSINLAETDTSTPALEDNEYYLTSE